MHCPLFELGPSAFQPRRIPMFTALLAEPIQNDLRSIQLYMEVITLIETRIASSARIRSS